QVMLNRMRAHSENNEKYKQLDFKTTRMWLDRKGPDKLAGLNHLNDELVKLNPCLKNVYRDKRNLEEEFNFARGVSFRFLPQDIDCFLDPAKRATVDFMRQLNCMSDLMDATDIKLGIAGARNIGWFVSPETYKNIENDFGRLLSHGIRREGYSPQSLAL
ncbi:MAG: hypothetical protein PHX43_02830, partial [Alphaproteobacteria bacterium]|nr:hypothetical protein [Alphaproteobacteria bacterium]